MSGVIRFVTDDAGAGASGDTMSENAAAKPASAVAAVAISDVVMVSPQETRVEPVRASSPSWFVARINAVSRIIGALLLCIPMFISLDVVSASVALGIEFALLWIGGVAPWTVCRKTWPVWVAAAGSFISVFLYGRTSGEILWQSGWIVISEGSIYLAIATAIRVAAIAVPGVIQAFGLLVLSIRRATKLATAMEARGFGSNAPRSQARIARLKPIDWLFYAICLAVPLVSLGVAIGTGNWHFAFQGV